MLGIDRHHLAQKFFALGFIIRHRAQPQPRLFIARLGDDDEIEHFAGFVFQPALRSKDALSEKFFRVHS